MTQKRRTPLRQLLDAAGNPVVGYVQRKTRVADPWVARTVRYFRPVHYQYIAHRNYNSLVQRAQIQFRESNRWHLARQVFVMPKDGQPDIPLMKALRAFSHDFWWVSARGSLERKATLYEERMMPNIAPPREGWRIVPTSEVATLIGRSKGLEGGSVVPYVSETNEDERARARVRMRHRAIAIAEQTLKRHEQALARTQKLVLRWRTRVTHLRGNVCDEFDVRLGHVNAWWLHHFQHDIGLSANCGREPVRVLHVAAMIACALANTSQCRTAR